MSEYVAGTTQSHHVAQRGVSMAVNLRALIGKLNHTTRSAVEAAAGLCLSRTHYDVEIEHYLMKLLDNTDGDFAAILKQETAYETPENIVCRILLEKKK